MASKGKRAKPSELDAATTLVTSRPLIAYSEAKKSFDTAGENAKKEKATKDTMDSLILFKSDIAAYVRSTGSCRRFSTTATPNWRSAPSSSGCCIRC